MYAFMSWLSVPALSGALVVWVPVAPLEPLPELAFDGPFPSSSGGSPALPEPSPDLAAGAPSLPPCSGLLLVTSPCGWWVGVLEGASVGGSGGEVSVGWLSAVVFVGWVPNRSTGSASGTSIRWSLVFRRVSRTIRTVSGTGSRWPFLTCGTC